MKKVLRVLLVFFIVLIIAFLVLAAIAPRKITVTRTAIIKAPRSVVFSQIIDFKNWKNWSPWYEMDTAMVITYYGTTGEEGSGYHWEGEKSGIGDMVNKGVHGDTIYYHLTFKKPWESNADGYFIVQDNEDGTTEG